MTEVLTALKPEAERHLGLPLLLMLGRRGPLCSLLSMFGVQVVFTWGAAVIAASLVSMPLALYSAVEGGRTGEARLYLLVTIVLSFVVIFIIGHAQRQSRAYREEGRS
jgi:ABC-type molybdate transport system permease subunit